MEIKPFLRHLIKEAKAIGPNSKTIKSIDVDTVCPRKEYVEYNCGDDDFKKKFIASLEKEQPGSSVKWLEGYNKAIKDDRFKECSYCYVKGARDKGKDFFLAKQVHTDTEYNSSNILKMRQDSVDKLNAVGGIRLFSHSDYKPRKKNYIKTILDDAEKRGLNVKAITKVPQFVTDFADHPALKLINVSVDTVGDGMKHETALQLKREYPKKVKIRAVITNVKDLLDPIMDHVDVFTFYHGSAKKLKALGYTNFTGKDRDAIGANTYEYSPKHGDSSKKEVTEAKDIPPTEDDHELARKINARIKQLDIANKTCCIGSHCSVCKLKCGGAGCGKDDLQSLHKESKLISYLENNEFNGSIETILCDKWNSFLNEDEDGIDDSEFKQENEKEILGFLNHSFIDIEHQTKNWEYSFEINFDYKTNAVYFPIYKMENGMYETKVGEYAAKFNIKMSKMHSGNLVTSKLATIKPASFLGMQENAFKVAISHLLETHINGLDLIPHELDMHKEGTDIAHTAIKDFESFLKYHEVKAESSKKFINMLIEESDTVKSYYYIKNVSSNSRGKWLTSANAWSYDEDSPKIKKFKTKKEALAFIKDNDIDMSNKTSVTSIRRKYMYLGKLMDEKV